MRKCVFCLREDVPGMHGHHVIPKSKRGTEMEDTCGSCGSFIHQTWTNNELRDVYNTVDKVVSDEKFVKYLKFIGKQAPSRKFKTARIKSRSKGKYK